MKALVAMLILASLILPSPAGFEMEARHSACIPFTDPRALITAGRSILTGP